MSELWLKNTSEIEVHSWLQIKPRKNSEAPTGFKQKDLCNTGVTLYQLNHAASTDVTLYQLSCEASSGVTLYQLSYEASSGVTLYQLNYEASTGVTLYQMSCEASLEAVYHIHITSQSLRITGIN